MDAVRLIVAMPLIVIGCLLAAAGVVLLRRSLSYTATATVHKTDVPQGTDASHHSPALLRFTTRDGRLVEVSLPRAPGYEAGEQVTVIYDPAYPEIAQIASPLRLWLLPAVLAVAGVAIAVVGATNLASAVR